MVSWGHRSKHPDQYHDRFSRFCRAHGRDRQTDRPRCSVCSNMPHRAMLWCGLIIITILLLIIIIMINTFLSSHKVVTSSSDWALRLYLLETGALYLTCSSNTPREYIRDRLCRRRLALRRVQGLQTDGCIRPPKHEICTRKKLQNYHYSCQRFFDKL